MHHFICLRNNQHCRAGQWFFAEAVGEPLFAARLTSGPRGMHLTQTSRVGIPFHVLAPFIIEPGFKITRAQLRAMEGRMSELPSAQEIADFQRDNADLIEPEMERRYREADPGIRDKSGIVVPGGAVHNDEAHWDKVPSKPAGTGPGETDEGGGGQP